MALNDMARFTAYLSAKERQMLEARARMEGYTTNGMLRVALRAYLGLDTPQSHMLHVTTETSEVSQ